MPPMYYKAFTALLLLAVHLALPAATLPGRIVPAEWLQAHLDSSVTIIDARDHQAYRKSHIRGAVSLPVAATFGPVPRADLVAPLASLRKLFSDAGISSDTNVVIYDAGSFIDAARLVWILEASGHQRVAILDGGFAGWQMIAGASETPEVVPLPARFVPAANPERVATKLSTRLAINNPNVTIIDARSNAEYQGKKSHTARKGHIPSAINIPWNRNFAEVNGVKRLKDLDALRAIYADVDPSKKVIAYCNKGKQSALTHFIMRELGYDVAAYDGSWYEWSNDDKLPIE